MSQLASLHELSNEYPIVLFDGECVLCNNCIQKLIRSDKNGKLRFAVLQSSLADPIKEEGVDSIILLYRGKKYFHSDAVLELLPFLDWKWKWLLLGKLLPRFVRDFIYKRIAKNRYSIWGKYDSCMIPTEEQKKLFIQ